MFWCSYISYQPHCTHCVYLFEIYRCYRQWMDFYRGLYLDDWRYPNAVPWDYR